MDFVVELKSNQKIVNNKYKVCHKIGEGSFSSVYSISLNKCGQIFTRAIKLVQNLTIKQSDKVIAPQISIQISVLKSITNSPYAEIGFAKFYEFGYEHDYNYLVMELFGPNLENLMKLCGGKFSLKTTLIISLQILDRLQSLHNIGYVYKDVKPQNFVMGLQNKSHIVHLIDFGKCKMYKCSKTGQHIPFKQKCKFDGEVLFSSINTHNGTEFSRRDDIEALVNLMIYMTKGKLPWMLDNEFKNRKQRNDAIEDIKKKNSVEQLAYKLPMFFADLLYYARTLNFYEKPDYDYIRHLMHSGFKAEQDNLSMIFDWNQIDQLEFNIYSGTPKIIQGPDQVKRVQSQRQHQEAKSLSQMKNSRSRETEMKISNKKSQLTQKEVNQNNKIIIF